MSKVSFRSSHRKCSIKNFVLKDFTQETLVRKTPVLEFLFNKLTGMKAWNFIKKQLQDRCFPGKFAKFLRASILKNICEWMLLFFPNGLWELTSVLLVRIKSKGLFIWEKLSRLDGKIVSTRSRDNANFHQQKRFNSYDLKVSPANRLGGGGIFSHERIFPVEFFLRSRYKENITYVTILYTVCNNNSIVILFTKNLKQLFFLPWC